MTYSPGSPGYPPAQQQPSGYPAATAAPAPDFAKEPGESKLPQYLTYAVLGLGLAAYFANFGPMVSTSGDANPGAFLAALSVNPTYGLIATVLAALLAGVGLLPKVNSYTAVVAAVSILGLLLIVETTLGAPDGVSIGWGLWLVLAFALFEAVAAIAVLLFESGVITPPAPRPKYDPYQQQYGQYGQYPQQQYGQQQPYYGQPAAQGQPAGYGSQYGGYGAGQAQPQNQSNVPTQNAIPTSVANQSSGGFGAQPPAQSGPQPSAQSAPQQTVVTGSQPAQSGPAPAVQTPTTPPTGFPSYGQPASSSAGGGSQAGSAPVNYSTPSSNQTQTYGQGPQSSPGSAPV